VVSIPEQAAHYLAGGVVGVGDEDERLIHAQRIHQQDHLVEQGPLVAIGEDHAFMNAAGQRNGEDAFRGSHQHRDGLTGMAEDVFGLGVGVGGLMEFLDARHLLARPGDLDPVPHEYGAVIDAQNALLPEDQTAPEPCERIETKRRAVQKVQDPVIARR